MRYPLFWLSILLPAAGAAAAPPVVLSVGPDQVAITIYRDPERGDGQIARDNPTAFALIAETRTVTLPPGIVTIRFEGVAGGIVPQSAILFGTDQRERNRDAALLSQKGLVDRYTGQQVTLRRFDPATGKTVEEQATIRSAANRMVISTPRGAEAVYCTGLAQTLLYPGAPTSLSAKPVLSMTTKEQPGGQATITLAYIATGFDWDATYIGTLQPDGKEMALFAWLTMASGDETSFLDATTSAVAGRINRSAETRDDSGRRARAEAAMLDTVSQCWPDDTTSDVARQIPPPSVLLPAPPAPMMMAMSDIIVTAQRRQGAAPFAVTAQAEGLGDLKLYRIPVPVTVAARSQKQVAFLNSQQVKGEMIYRSRLSSEAPEAPQMLFRFQNRKADGLGDPLPAGKVILYQESAFGRQLLGETTISDKADEEEVELVFGKAQNITIETGESHTRRGRRYDVTVRNANSVPVIFELEFMNQPDRTFERLPRRTISRPGKRVWRVTLQPNVEHRLSYEMRDVEKQPPE